MEKNKIRKPAVAGQFYPETEEALKKQIAALLDLSSSSKKPPRQDSIACMLPHAGYIYSGAVAAATISRVAIKDTVILLGPNHTGLGEPLSVMSEGFWETPLGKVKIDEELAKTLLASCEHLCEGSIAHHEEHSLEVQVPFLQYFKPDVKIIPITILSHEVQVLKETGRNIAASIIEAGLKDKVLIVASSDMTHYEPQAEAQKKDSEAIQAILEFNEDKLVEKIQAMGISMCGYAPVIVMLSAAKALDAKKSELVKYQTSAEATGDTESVVGYAGIIIH